MCAQVTDKITVIPGDLGYEVTPLLFGGNIEHSRNAISGGLSAQMLRNRKFVGMPNSFRGNADCWFIIGDKTFAMIGSDQTQSGNIDADSENSTYTRHSPLGYHMRRRYECNNQRVQNIHGGVSGIGQQGLLVEKTREYEFRIVLRTDIDANLTVALTSHGGKTVYCAESVKVSGNEWTTYTAILKPDTTDSDADLRITFEDKARLIIGAVSLMPTDNFHGMRRDVVDRMKEMKLKMLRWPGGNFAGEYNWMDGLLPSDMRAPLEAHILHLTQPSTLGYDFSEINTDDFIALCREIGAEPSITLNITWNTHIENANWVEYCNGDETTTYGKMRIDRGFKEPFGVKLWSIGNEAGYRHMEGDNTPDGYRAIAEANAKAMLEKDPDLILCTSGFHPTVEWAENANNKLSHLATMTALHNYINAPTYKSKAKYKEEHINCLKGIEECRDKIHTLRSYLSDDISIAFDEWNCWYMWNRPKDTFVGIFTAKMLHMFIEEQKASNVSLSATYQPINEGSICVTPEKAELTPMGEAFGLLAEHCCGRVLYVSDAVTVTEKNGVVTASLINDSYDSEKAFELKLDGKVDIKQLKADDIGPYTEFDKSTWSDESVDGSFNIVTPPLSVTLLKFHN